MDIVTTSLEALIQRATCSQNQCPDAAAIDAFCGLINKEPESAQTATRFITAKVHSLQEWEALQALNVLDACMKRCGSSFHMEVGKFRFLNELIKLVSPKYNGAHTPETVKRRVLELMQSWTVFYPKEFKIKEAYEMLIKQGVVKEESLRVESEVHKTLEQSTGSVLVRNHDSIFQDTERSRLLQKLLQSKNPDDLQAANRLIKTMVKEDERRVEMNSRHRSELEAAHNNARLLSEMLDSYSRETGSAQDLELIRELHASCLRFHTNVQTLLSEIPQQDDRLFNEVLIANDELSEVLEKYNTVILQGSAAGSAGGALLDLSTPSGDGFPPPAPVPTIVPTESLLCDQLTAISMDSPLPNSSGVPLQSLFSVPLLSQQPLQLEAQPTSHLAALGDIFSSLAQPIPPSSQPLPTTPLKSGFEKNTTVFSTTRTGLEELDAISESLLKQSLPQVTPKPPKVPVKVPMNQLGSHQASPLHSNAILLHSDTVTTAESPTPSLSIPMNQLGSQQASPLHSNTILLLSDTVTTSESPTPSLSVTNNQEGPLDLLMDSTTEFSQVNGDLPIVDISTEPSLDTQEKPTEELKTELQPAVVKSDMLVKPLGDITVPLENIKPGNLPPLTVLEERGICVTIHFGRERPRPDVSVFVVTTTSSSQFPISNYLFQAIVPKGCRLRLQPPSSMELPAHSPFLPPAAITQVMLVASSSKEPILLRVVISFTMDDETITEMKELEKFPLLNS